MTGDTSPHGRGADLDTLLASARDDTAPLGADLRTRILAQAPARSPAPSRGGRIGARIGGWVGGLVAMPGAALLGLWVGLAQPAAVLGLMPITAPLADGTAADATSAETALLGEVFGTVWADETLEEME